ncbi:MAG: DEAD/DEAH box helicase [Acetobacter indonesiensis]|nr:DEAD/DEAH box helicase [Acetobacter indonesiensis]MCI1545997.1 DEAD/DEAH box helicase [Acetobacter indonesiensis]MCI1765443.1 DEAD/DEAH box helicase [Acetobacter indonesiensis]
MSNSFEAMGLLPSLCTHAAKAGLTTPTPIQQQAIPASLADKDVLAVAPTGTGKTAAYVLPLLQHLMSTRRAHDALVLVPTRELALQTAGVFRTCLGQDPKSNRQKAGTPGIITLYGGVDRENQIANLAHDGPRVLIATPGRLLDLVHTGEIDLFTCTRVVLDEGDRLFAPEFFEESATVVEGLPPVRQTSLFSATLPKTLTPILQKLLRKPVEIHIEKPTEKRGLIRQGAFFLEPAQRLPFLKLFFNRDRKSRTIIFVKTKADADQLAATLKKLRVGAAPLHGDLTQTQRTATVASFAEGRMPVLVATDIAARGLDVPDVRTVINFDPPDQAETYLHRIGRTGRNGKTGTALTFCSMSDRQKLRQIEVGAAVKIRILSEEQALPPADQAEQKHPKAARRP